MGLKNLISDLTDPQRPSINTSDYPYHATYDGGGSSHGDSKSIFDTKLFQQREFGYGAEISTPLITRNFKSNSDRPLPRVEENTSDSVIDIFTSGFIRGGLKTSTERALTDFNRLRKFFITPKGANFLLKQVALQRMNPKIQEGTVQLLGQDAEIFGNTSRVFNPIQLIPGVNNLNEAAALQHTGVFINRAGLTPESYGFESGYNYDESNPTKYEYVVRKSDQDQFQTPEGQIHYEHNGFLFTDKNAFSSTDEDKVKNRLLQLYQLKTYRHTGGSIQITDDGVTGAASFLGDAATFIADIFLSTEAANRIGDSVESAANTVFDILGFGSYPTNGIATDANYLLLYGGGPASTDGLGKTRVKRYKQDNKGNFIKIDIGGYTPLPSPDNISKLSDFRSIRRDGEFQIDLQRAGAIQKIEGNKVTLFQNTPKSTNYTTKNMYSRIGVGNVGNLSIKGEGYETRNDTTVDTLQSLDVVKVKNGQHDLRAFRDLIRFRMEAVDTDDPTTSDSIIFRAFLENWQDSFNSNWNEYVYNGRGESLYTYGGFKRTINFSFKVAAQSRHEMKPIYRKLNFLVSNLAPDYTGDGNLRMRSPFMRLTIGSNMDRIPGFFNNVNIQWNTNYPYEIAMDSPEGGKDSAMLVLPHVLDVSCGFTPIHNFLPQKSIHSPFILPHESNRTLTEAQKWYKEGVSSSPGGPSTSGVVTSNVGDAVNTIVSNVDTGIDNLFTIT